MISFNDFQRQWQDTRQDTLDAVDAAGGSGWYVLGSEVRAFEEALARNWGVRNAIGVGSGLDAIEISLRVLGCKPGDKVLTTPVSAFATTLAIVKLGAVPVFVDCDGFGLIDLDACECALRADSSIRFIVPVHLYGHSLDLRGLRQLMEKYAVAVVEDCAQSILARFDDTPVGTIGQCAATSFYPTKNLGALGDGGAILTNSDSWAECARCLRDYGQSGKYKHKEIGYNSRLDELQAAILRRAHLPHLAKWTAARRRIANSYCRAIQQEHIRIPGAPVLSDSCWHLFPILVDAGRKQDFMSHMREQGISVAEHYPTAILDQPALAGVPHELVGECARARQVCSSEVSLPIHPYLSEAEIDAVIQGCNSWRQ
jgi:dTDP-4-amino-4,6-dideoxygalactose transaminase